MEERLSYDLIFLRLKVWKRKGIWKRDEGMNEEKRGEKVIPSQNPTFWGFAFGVYEL